MASSKPASLRVLIICACHESSQLVALRARLPKDKRQDILACAPSP